MNIYDMLLAIPALVVSLSFHEFAHAKAADWQGDPTPRRAGRLTLNPIVHIDPIGMVMFWFFRFGWAKPVPVNPYLFRNKRFGEIYVSLAGPSTNLILAIFSIMLFRTGITAVNNAFDSTVKLMIVYNVSFAVFNLLPIPPLDGSHVIKGILSPRLLAVYRQIEPFSMLVLILLLWTGFFSRFLGPVVYGIINSLDSIVIVIFSAIGVL